jgi:hypothetical protein
MRTSRGIPLIVAAVAAVATVSGPPSLAQAPLASVGAPGAQETASGRHERGVNFHLERRLDEAALEYAQALALDPPRMPGADERATILRFAPRVFTTPDEIFPLKDAAAVLHPSERLIAYHLFWEDDIDFPDDNDPCDHEVVWVQFSPDRQSVERFWAFFHGRILEAGEDALRDARAYAMRPRVNVQWGKHGSMPFGWESMSIVGDTGDLERAYYTVGKPISLAEYNRGTWQKLKTDGRRLIDHPLARRLQWPDRFTGTWERFVDFSRPVDLAAAIKAGNLMSVTRWNSAVINRYFLAYNFRPKTEWPVERTGGLVRADAPPKLVEAASLADYRLPPKAVFDRAMPRYPNVWFYLDTALADSYGAAVRLVADQLRGPMRLLEDHGPFENPEGCDFEVRLEHLQPWEDAAQRSLQHAHAFHLRYYHSALEKQQLDQITLRTPTGDRRFYRVAASAHYEVEHANPNHADVEICPVCGRTGEYQDLKGNLVEMVHDPLGVELLLNGTIRNQPVLFEEDRREVGGIRSLSSRFAVQQQVFAAASGDRNTLRIGVVVLAPRR